MRIYLLKALLISIVGGLGLVLVQVCIRYSGVPSDSILHYIIAFVFGVVVFGLGGIWLKRKQKQCRDEVLIRESQLENANREISMFKEAKKRSEQDLVQSQKLEALGRLAGGIAHDVNNVLASIMTIASSIRMDNAELEGGQVEDDDVTDIIDACRRGRDLTLSLLGFARKGEIFKRPISLVKEIKEVKKLLERVSPKTLRIELKHDETIPQIEGDPSEIKNVLMNLCINGIDAMGGNGVLTVSLDIVEVEGKVNNLPSGKYVLLQVIDNGEGMSEETVKRAFEPFYTTKPEGKGTGLGLPRVWGIVKEHSGIINIESERGVGTTMKLMLPALDEIQEDPGIRGSIAPVFATSNNVLLIDDEALIRKSAKRILEKIGYKVWVAENGKEAVDIFKRKKDEIDLVLLDMIMPVMDGPATFVALREMNPDIPVILCSGYSKDDSATSLLKEEKVGFVQKPFSVGELSSKMAQYLEND